MIQFSWGQGPFSHTKMPVMSDEHLKTERLEIGFIIEIVEFSTTLHSYLLEVQ